MKDILVIGLYLVVIILCVVAGLATPAAIIYGLYLWVKVNAALPDAIWEGAVVWICMLICVVPAMVCLFFANMLDD